MPYSRKSALWPSIFVVAAALACSTLGAPSASASPLAIGDVVHRTLATGTADRWTFEGYPEAPVNITAAGSGFIAQIELYGPDGELVARAAGAGANEPAQIVNYMAAEAGAYLILVGSADGAAGQYVLALSESSPSASRDTPGGAISYDSLTEDFISDAAGDIWTFEGAAGEAVTIAAQGYDFDVRLRLSGPDGAILTEDDDSGPGTDALIQMFLLPADGTYSIFVSGQDNATGAYAVGLTMIAGSRGPLDEDGGFLRYDEAVSDLITSGAVDEWVFDGGEGDEITVLLYSSEFDTELELLGPDGELLLSDDDGGPGRSSLISGYRLPGSGAYTLAVSGRGDGGGGYLLGLVRSQTALPTGTDGGPINYGDVVDDVISDADGDEWTFEGKARDTVTIAMTGDDFDTLLELYGPDGSLVAADDDSGPDLSSLLRNIRLADAGQYTIVALGYGGERGAYTLALELGEPPEARGELRAGDTLTESLGSAGGEWILAGQAGVTISVILTSPDFDPTLDLYDPAGELVAHDDDSGPGVGALLQSVSLPSDGKYSLVATSADGAAGTFSLSVLAGLYVVPGDTPGGSIELGQTMSDTVVNESGDTWTFAGTAGEFVTISLSSDEFDPYLELHGPSGSLVGEDDDSGEDLNALLENLRLPATGTYTITARAFGGGGDGAYTLTLEKGEAAVASGELVYGDSETGELTTRSGDWWTFEGTAGDFVDIAVRSDDFDTVLELYGPDGNQVAMDDDSGEDTNSFLQDVELPLSGTYVILVRSYGSDTGEYTLTLEQNTDPPDGARRYAPFGV